MHTQLHSPLWNEEPRGSDTAASLMLSVRSHYKLTAAHWDDVLSLFCRMLCSFFLQQTLFSSLPDTVCEKEERLYFYTDMGFEQNNIFGLYCQTTFFGLQQSVCRSPYGVRWGGQSVNWLVASVHLIGLRGHVGAQRLCLMLSRATLRRSVPSWWLIPKKPEPKSIRLHLVSVCTLLPLHFPLLFLIV